MTNSIDTLALHAGAQKFAGSVTTPVFHTSTYAMEEGVPYRDIRYARLSNSPNHEVLHNRLAHLMAAEEALVCGSGMAAISTTLEELVPIGGTMAVASTLYGGTAGLLARWESEGRAQTESFDATRPSAFEPTAHIDLIYVETIANPTMVPANLPGVVRLGQTLGVPVVVDNTFGSPVCVRPLELGADLVVHSATKYLNGHSDVTAGVVGGRSEVLGPIRTRLAYNGAMLDPGAAYLLERGMKTLGVRVRRQCESASILAARLLEHPLVESVHFPDLAEAPWLNHAGAMLAFELPTEADAAKFFEHLRYFVYAPSLGGVE